MKIKMFFIFVFQLFFKKKYRLQDFGELSLPDLLFNIYSYAKYIIKGNFLSFYNDYTDYYIEFAERQ